MSTKRHVCQIVVLWLAMCVGASAQGWSDLAVYLDFDNASPNHPELWSECCQSWFVPNRSIYGFRFVFSTDGGDTLNLEPGKFGTAIAARGWVMSYQTPFPPEAVASGSLSVLVWVNPSDDGIETWALRVADATNQDDLIIGLAQSLAPVIHMRVDNINRWSLIGKNLIDTGRWTHLAWVIDTRTDSARLYVDGRFDGQVDTDGVLPRDWGSLEESRGGVGISLENLNGEHNGVLGAVAQMDELNIWKRALTEAEIRSVMDRSAFSLAVEPQGKQTTTWAMLKSR